MKTKSPEFMSQCRVLNFPWMNKRRRSKSECKTVSGQAEYSQILMFQPPSVEVGLSVNESAFPVIQMMDGKEPFIWEDGQTKFSDIPKEIISTKSSCPRASVKPISKNRIPRPKNAFILYRSHVSQLLKETMTFKVRESNISSLVSEMWKKESDVVHAYYARRAALEWVKYMKKVQQQRSASNTDKSEIKSPTPPPATLKNESSFFTSESQSNTVPYTQISFPNSTQTPVQENSVVTSYNDPFVGTILYNSSPDTSNLGFTNTDLSIPLSSSPHSSNEDIFDPTYNDTIAGNSGYLFSDKSSVPLSFKDFLFSCNMNQLDTNCAYTFNSTPVFPNNTYPCMVDTGLGMDINIRWPGLMQTTTPWPVNIV